MPVFKPKKFTYFFERMLQRAIARTELTDLESGGVLSTLLGAVARELDDISYQMVALQSIWDLDTATGVDLDARGADCNPDAIIRKSDIAATGTVIFGRTNVSSVVTVPAGTQVAVVGGFPTYRTSVSTTLAIGVANSAPVAIVCDVEGDVGNIEAANTSIPTGIGEIVANVGGIETVYNDSACTGGQDVESDAEFRARITTYLRSLSRGTPDALKFSVLGLEVTGYGRIAVAQVEEKPIPFYGEVTVWIDDGNGTTVNTENNLSTTPETVVSAATGGEVRLLLTNHALVDSVPITVIWYDFNNTKGGGANAPYTLKQGSDGDPVTDYDYLINYATGKITLNPGATGTGTTGLPTSSSSPFGVEGLQPDDSLTATYGWYVGLISEAQKVIDGDPSDRVNYPGYRAAGTYVRVKAPTVYWQVIKATVKIEQGYTPSTVLSQVSSAIESYVNSLTINGDVIFSEMVYAAQSIEGVFDITFTQPNQSSANPNVLIGSGELARTSSAYITITGA